MIDIRTTEGREELRATPPYELECGADYAALLAALDGLDIAQERLIKALLKILRFYLQCGSLKEAQDFDWVDWAEDAEGALDEWHNWQANPDSGS